MIACLPIIVNGPTPATGLAATSPTGTSPNHPFSAALQAATQNLLHPGLKPNIAGAKQTTKGSPIPDPKTGNAAKPRFVPNPLATANTGVETNSLPVQTLLMPAVSPMPTAVLPQPTTVAETKLEAATLDTEQSQSTVQIARVGTITGAQAASPVTTGQQQFTPLISPTGSGTTSVPSGSTNFLPAPETTPLSSAIPELMQGDPKGTPATALQQPKQQVLGGFDLPTVAAGKKETAPLPAESAKASSAPAALPSPALHPAKTNPQPTLASPQAAGNTTPPGNAARSVPNQPDHSGLTTETKNQAAEASANDASSVPRIPIQLVMPDINVMKVSPKATEASTPTAPTLSGSTPGSAVQAVMETSKKNADAGENGNSQPGSSKGNTTSFSFTPTNNQVSDGSTIPGNKTIDISASSPPAGSPVAHGAVSTSDATGTSVKTDGQVADALRSAASGTTEAETRAQAAAGYANSLLHSARLVERVGQAELRIGIQTGEFGNVDIRTSMVRNQFTAQISVERGELGKVLAAELPSLQNKLSEQRLPGANITLQNQSGGSAGFGQGSRQSQTMQQIVIPYSPEAELAPALMSTADTSISNGRLDVHM